MGEQRVRVMVGEGQTTRKGLLRFVLENEGYDVVAEATSTLELAQRLVIHRPDVVVVDDGIDASAVGMMREVLPSAKVVLVWPRGVPTWCRGRGFHPTATDPDPPAWACRRRTAVPRSRAKRRRRRS